MEKERKEARETIEDLAETMQTVNKIRPKRSRIQKPQPYEFEYDETGLPEDENPMEE